MEIDEAIMAFSQSEKIKAGLISISQALELLRGLAEGEKRGGEKIINVLLSMIDHEIKLARTVTRHEGWDDAGPYIDKAMVMINSGVGHEATVHLSKALSKVTTIGQQSMTFLKEKGLL
ncbi:MAG: hypothetical protein ISS66_20985 [Desulfobacteraceae bacterium]|nr:hypothetical protein [Desulfobacteraceae bacterium]